MNVPLLAKFSALYRLVVPQLFEIQFIPSVEFAEHIGVFVPDTTNTFSGGPVHKGARKKVNEEVYATDHVIASVEYNNIPIDALTPPTTHLL